MGTRQVGLAASVVLAMSVVDAAWSAPAAPQAQQPAGTVSEDLIERPKNAILGRRKSQGLGFIPLCGILQFYRGTRVYDPYSLEDIGAAHAEAYPRMVRFLTRMTESRDLNTRWRSRYELAELHSGQGEMDLCLAEIGELLQLLETPGTPMQAKQLFLATAGVAHMRRGEVNNCLNYHNAESCIAPLSPLAQHREPEDFRTAKDYLLRYLTLDPDHLQVRWLLNVVAMGLGEYPDRVPPQFLIPMPEADPALNIRKFRDVAGGLGIDPWTLAGGSIVDDFNGDGLLDIVCTTWDSNGRMSYFEQDGRGGFVDRTDASGLASQVGGLNAVQGDYDNDGDLDILVLRGAWEDAMRNSLLANDGAGRFTDVTAEAGLLSPAGPTQTGAWADYDNDGDLDLVVGNESRLPEQPYPCQLFRNNGDGTFTDVAAAAGVTVTAFTKGCAWGDYDNDGDPDLFLSNSQARNTLFRNDGDGTFTDVTDTAGVGEPIASFPCWFFDYDNDGWLDLFVAAYDDPLDTYRCYLGQEAVGDSQRLFRNLGNGRFEDVTPTVGPSTACMTMGANFGDLNNDGFLDLYLATGAPPYGDVVPNTAFLNVNGESFADVTVPSGLGHLQKGHAIAFGDLDNDGDQDIYAEIGGAVAGDPFSNALFENPGHGNNWITIRPRGTTSNRFGVGARIRLTVVGEDGGRSLRCRTVGWGGSFGSSSLQQEIGLGRGGRIDTLEIVWPASGTKQVFRNVAHNRIVEITEGDGTILEIDLPKIEWRRDGTSGHEHHHH